VPEDIEETEEQEAEEQEADEQDSHTPAFFEDKAEETLDAKDEMDDPIAPIIDEDAVPELELAPA
jgi:transcription termination factor NusB